MHQLDIIENELKDIKRQLASFGAAAVPPQQIHIVDQDELSKLLGVTKPTIITWEKKGKIPSLRLGSCVRYNWPQVIAALSNQKIN